MDRPKRTRTAFSKWQLDVLEKTFELNPYLVGEQRTALAKRLSLSETQIKVWYQNRRTKQRKECPRERSESSDKHSSHSLSRVNEQVEKWIHRSQEPPPIYYQSTLIHQLAYPSSSTEGDLNVRRAPKTDECTALSGKPTFTEEYKNCYRDYDISRRPPN